ncbi:nucleotidyltransferase family protein [Methanosarcina sp. UBA411]|uniref:nucleotidyltransferase family protein n=1 Tax=Methanosarcina sp. UBA411 TaxID=1915589 RepID=UPI0025F9E202|nr:nucleotidyltransferase domain-containing protein [Methanosarcina sp. UBA411]
MFTKEESDIDVLVRFEEGATLLHFTGLGYYLEDLFGVPIDVVSERALYPMMKDDVLKELVPV